MLFRSFSPLFLAILFLLNGKIDLHSQIDLSYAESIEWREVGPYRGGRSCAVTGVPGRDNLFYFGSTGGGIWKTVDGGRSWENISDGFFGGSTGAIAVSSSDHNVIYVGGGEKTVRGNVSFGYGIWKSEDGGKTWKQKGLKKSRHIARLRVDPNDHNIVYAAVLGDLFKDTEERGVYKSSDGGESWKRVLFSNASSGAVDLIIDPNNPRHLMASTWNVRRTPYSLSSGGEGSALWQSTDYGETWIDISENKGMPEGVRGIIGIAISPVNSERMWTIIENEKEGGVYRSDDGGQTWDKVNESRSLRQRAWYYTRIYADPQDMDVVYVMNVSYHKSKDGGKTFSAKRAPHGDHHDLWISPENPKRMIIGDDGGAQITYDGGETWSTYHNQSTAQFYRVTTDNHFPYRIYAAQQDNSTIRIAHRTGADRIDERHWERTAGGESAHIAIDPNNNEIVYGGSYDGFMTRFDHTTGHVKAINVWPDNPMGHGAEEMKYRFQWNFPILFSRHDVNTLYTASNHLHVSTDEGQSWKTISGDLTRNDSTKLKSSGGPITQDNTSVEYYCTIFAVGESHQEKGTIWVGSDDGLIHLTRDGGSTWSDITPSHMPKWLMINCIEPDPHDAATCYIAGTLYKAGDYKPYIYKTTDYGKTWKKIIAGIADEHFTRAIRVDPVNKSILYAGTESGVYISTDRGNTWSPMQLNLPIVPITDMTIKNDDLIVSTQGRGLWMIDELSVLRQTITTKANKEIRLFKPADTYRMRGSQKKELKGAGTNHPAGVTTHFYLPEFDNEKDTLLLHYLNTSGDTIRTFSNHSEDKKTLLKDIEKGPNKHNWNMRYPSAKGFDGMVLWWGSTTGATVVPGTYEVHLSLHDTQLKQSFTLKGDPRLNISVEDYLEQQAFTTSINDKVTESHEAIIEMRALKSQMSEFKSYHKDTLIDQKITAIDSMLTEIEEALYQTKNESRQDPLNYPIRLTNKLAHINALVQVGDGLPPQQMYDVRDELFARIDKQLDIYQGIKENDLPALNKLIKINIDNIIKVKE